MRSPLGSVITQVSRAETAALLGCGGILVRGKDAERFGPPHSAGDTRTNARAAMRREPFGKPWMMSRGVNSRAADVCRVALAATPPDARNGR